MPEASEHSVGDDVEFREERGPARRLDAFLRSFRRRALASALLRLSFAAVAVNEAGRWAAIALNARYDLRLPVLGLGPLFLAVLLAGLLRRWSPRFTARRADAALGFRDRFVSYLDFSTRPDLSAAFRGAQARETAAALQSLSPRPLPPLPRLVALGPLLLLASIAYPLFLGGGSGRGGPLVVQRHSPGTAERSPGDPGAEDAGRERSPAREKPPAPEADKGGGKETPTPDPALPALPEGSREHPKQGDPARSPTGDPPRKDGTPLQSFQVGQQLSRVVDPFYRTSAPPAAPDPPRGSVTFRLFPTGRGAGGASAAGAGASEEVVVDFGTVPERYRALVQRYFSLLGAGS